MKSRLWLREVENEEETDRLYKETKRGKQGLGRQGGFTKKHGGEKKEKGGNEKQGEWLAFSKRLLFKLVYLTLVWHFPSVPLLLLTAPQSGPLYASLPATKKHPEPLLQSALSYTVTPTPIHTSSQRYSTALTWLILSSVIYTFTTEKTNLKQPKLLLHLYLVDGQTCGKGSFVVAPWSTKGPEAKVIC